MSNLLTQRSQRTADGRPLQPQAHNISPVLTTAVVWSVWMGLMVYYGSVYGREIVALARVTWSSVQTPDQLRGQLPGILAAAGWIAAFPLGTSAFTIAVIQGWRLYVGSRTNRSTGGAPQPAQQRYRRTVNAVQFVVSTGAIAASATWAIQHVGDCMTRLVRTPMYEGLPFVWGTAVHIGLLLSAGLLIAGTADATARAWARRQAKPSVDEQRQYLRDLEGDPQVARRRRQVHQALHRNDYTAMTYGQRRPNLEPLSLVQRMENGSS